MSLCRPSRAQENTRQPVILHHTSYARCMSKQLCHVRQAVCQAMEAERPAAQAEGEQPCSTQEARLTAARRVERETCWNYATRKREQVSAHPCMQHCASDCVCCSAG